MKKILLILCVLLHSNFILSQNEKTNESDWGTGTYTAPDGTTQTFRIPPINPPSSPKEPNGKSPGTIGRPSSGNSDSNSEQTLKWKDGSVYVGTTKNGKPNGKGILRHSNGAVYEGNFINGKRNGIGKIGFPDNNGDIHKFEGSWSNDMWDGYGEYSNESYEISGNVFKNGRITGAKAKVQAKGKKGYYEGGIKDGKLHGIGTVYNAAERVKGTYKYENGEIVATLLSKSSKEGIQQIKDVIESASLGQDILTALTLYTSFSTYDDNPIVYVSNVSKIFDGYSKDQDFYFLLAKGVRDLNASKYNQIRKIAELYRLKFENENNIAEKNFWKRFKHVIRTKSKPSGPF